MSEKVKENFASVREQKELKTEENSWKRMQWGEIQENRRGDAKKIQIWKQKYKNGNQRVGGEGVVMQIVASKWKVPRKCEGKRTLLWSQKNIAGIAWHCDMGWHCGTVELWEVVHGNVKAGEHSSGFVKCTWMAPSRFFANLALQ